MKNLNHFANYELDKKQMNSVSGGKVRCAVIIDGAVISLSVAPSLSLDEASKSVEAAYGEYSWACGDDGK